MLDQILSSFAGSSEAGALVSSLTGNGLSADKAKAAIAATAEGTQQAVGSGGVGALLGLVGGGGGLGGALGGLMGGGGAASALGGLLGGATAPAAASNPMVDQIAGFVSQKVGIDAAMAKTVVNAVLPKLIEVVKGKTGGGALGGLL